MNTRAGLVCAGASEEGVHAVLVHVVLAARGHRRSSRGLSAHTPAVCEPGSWNRGTNTPAFCPTSPSQGPGDPGRVLHPLQASCLSVAEWTSPPSGWS